MYRSTAGATLRGAPAVPTELDRRPATEPINNHQLVVAPSLEVFSCDLLEGRVWLGERLGCDGVFS